jgi:hypothetical protein
MHRAAVAVAPAYRGRMLNTRAQWSAEFETGAGTHVKNSNGDVVPGQCAKTKAGHHRGKPHGTRSPSSNGSEEHFP